MGYAAVLILLALSAPSYGQTRITARFQDAARNRLTGYCDIKTTRTPFSNGGTQTVSSSVRIQFTNGNFSAVFTPTDIGVPGDQYYIGECDAPVQTVNGMRTSGHWGPFYLKIPTSASTYDISAVQVNEVVAASVSVPWQQITFAGMADGCFAVVNGIATTFPCAPYLVGFTISQMTNFVISQM